jgi:hypothetical protein
MELSSKKNAFRRYFKHVVVINLTLIGFLNCTNYFMRTFQFYLFNLIIYSRLKFNCYGLYKSLIALLFLYQVTVAIFYKKIIEPLNIIARTTGSYVFSYTHFVKNS